MRLHINDIARVFTLFAATGVRRGQPAFNRELRALAQDITINSYFGAVRLRVSVIEGSPQVLLFERPEHPPIQLESIPALKLAEYFTANNIDEVTFQNTHLRAARRVLAWISYGKEIPAQSPSDGIMVSGFYAVREKIYSISAPEEMLAAIEACSPLTRSRIVRSDRIIKKMGFLISQMNNNDKKVDLLGRIISVFEGHESFYASLITYYSYEGNAARLIELYDEMRGRGIFPTRTMYLAVAKAFSRIGNNERLVKFHEEIKANNGRLYPKYCSFMICFFMKNGLVKKCLELLATMEDQRIIPDERDYNYLITTLAQRGHGERASALFAEMRKRDYKGDNYTYWALIESAWKAGATEEIIRLFEARIADGLQPDELSYGAILYARARDKNFSEIRRLLDEKREKGLPPTKENYVTIITTLVKMGCGREAEEHFNDMTARGINPDEAIYNYLFNWHIRAGNESRAYELYYEMRAKRLTPTSSALNILIAYTDSPARLEKLLAELKGEPGSINHSLAILYKLGRYQELLDVGSSNNVANPRGLIDMAAAARHLRQYPLAEKILNKLNAVELCPRDKRAKLNEYGYLCVQLLYQQKMRKYFDKALESFVECIKMPGAAPFESTRPICGLFFLLKAAGKINQLQWGKEMDLGHYVPMLEARLKKHITSEEREHIKSALECVPMIASLPLPNSLPR